MKRTLPQRHRLWELSQSGNLRSTWHRLPLPVFQTFGCAFRLVVQVNADTVVAIEAEIALSEDSSAIAEWTLTDGVLNGYDELRLVASSSLEYTVRYSNAGGTTGTSPNTSISRVQ